MNHCTNGCIGYLHLDETWKGEVHRDVLEESSDKGG